MKAAGFLSVYLMLSTTGIALGKDSRDEQSWKEAILGADRMLQRGHFQEAREILVRTLPRVMRTEPDGARSIVTMNNLGTACQALGHFAEAEAWYCKALHLLEKNKAFGFENRLRQLNNLTSLYLSMGEYEKAQKMQGRILKLQTGTLGSCHPDVARQYENAAAIARSRHKPAEAEGWCRMALSAWQCLAGPAHPEIAALLNNLGVTFLDREDYARAMDYFAQSARMWEETSGPTHPGLAEPLLNLGRTYVLKREPDRAEAPLARALSIAEATYGGTHSLVARILDEEAAALKESGRAAEAAGLEHRARAILKELAREHRVAHGVDISQLLVERSK